LGVCSAGTAGAYASNIQYAAHGAESLVVMGNPANPATNVWHAPNYNSRLQMCGFVDVVGGAQLTSQACGTSTVTGGNTLLSATFNWLQDGTSSALNNGNLWGSSYTATGGPGITGSLTFNQTYSYDGVNRLLSVSDTSPSGTSTVTNYSRSFTYDPYGNMVISAASGITPAPNAANSIGAPAGTNYYSNNQYLPGSVSGSYDAAGNQLVVNGNNITYDAEGRQTLVAGLQVSEMYSYDGDGRRVVKSSTSAPYPTTVFVYESAGRPAKDRG
jgi:hypothetical protein